MKKTFFEIDERIQKAADLAMEKVADKFKELEEISEYNQQKVLSAFIKNQVSETMFTAVRCSTAFLPTSWVLRMPLCVTISPAVLTLLRLHFSVYFEWETQCSA